MIQLAYMAWMDAERQYNEWLEGREKKRQENEESNQQKSTRCQESKE